MRITKRIEAFKFGDDPVDFLEAVRAEYDEHYGRWYQERDSDGSITLDLRTGGWSHNEEIIDTMLENWDIKSIFYDAWERGGKFRFKFYKP